MPLQRGRSQRPRQHDQPHCRPYKGPDDCLPDGETHRFAGRSAHFTTYRYRLTRHRTADTKPDAVPKPIAHERADADSNHGANRLPDHVSHRKPRKCPDVPSRPASPIYGVEHMPSKR